MTLSGFLSMLLAVVGVLLMFVILLQRGRGGGLAGAFGGLGGQSAFGTKAGDVFTRITIGMAIVWVALAAGVGFAMRWETGNRFKESPNATASEDPVMGAGAKEKGAEKETPTDIFNDQSEPETDAKTGDTKEGPASTSPETKTGEGAEKAEEGAKPADATASGTAKEDAPKADEK